MNITGIRDSLRAEDADLAGSEFLNVSLAGAKFFDVNLAGSQFEDVNLTGVSLRNINCTDVHISDCNLAAMTINGIPVQEALNAYARRQDAQATTTGNLNSSAGFEVRPFQAVDRDAVVALWRSVFDYPAEHNDPARVIEAKISNDPTLLLVAVAEGKPVGTVIGGYDGHRGWIYSLAVDPAYRRRGIATALVRAVEKTLLARGCVKVNLQLLASNAATTAFYETLGYTVEPRISMGRLLT